jgi:hypothetical protein
LCGAQSPLISAAVLERPQPGQFRHHRPATARDSARQPGEEINDMRNLMLAAFAALALSATIAPSAHAFIHGSPHPATHAGPYDNTGHGPDETGVEGGGG